MQAGALGFLGKPFDSSTLVDLIDKAVESGRKTSAAIAIGAGSPHPYHLCDYVDGFVAAVPTAKSTRNMRKPLPSSSRSTAH
jgi:hypothetical protein